MMISLGMTTKRILSRAKRPIPSYRWLHTQRSMYLQEPYQVTLQFSVAIMMLSFVAYAVNLFNSMLDRRLAEVTLHP